MYIYKVTYYIITVLTYVCVYKYYTGALSATDNDDDYRVSYTGTMVDVRSCARPPRLFCPKSSTYIGNVCIAPKIYIFITYVLMYTIYMQYVYII